MTGLKSRAAGLSPARLLASRCAEVMRQRRRVRRRGDLDSVHDLRVATRRLNEALDFHAEWLPARPRRRLARRARRIRRALGPLRNADVMVELVGVLMRKSGADDRAKLAVLARVLQEQADGLRRKRGVRVPGIRRRAGDLLEALHDGPPVGARGRGAELLAARMPRLREALAAARTGKPDALHRLRLAIKRYRYTLEILDGAGVRPARAAVAEARGLQDLLGSLHDLDVLLDPDGPLAGAGSSSRLRARLNRERDGLLERALAGLTSFRPEKVLQAVRAAAGGGVAA